MGCYNSKSRSKFMQQCSDTQVQKTVERTTEKKKKYMKIFKEQYEF